MDEAGKAARKLWPKPGKADKPATKKGSQVEDLVNRYLAQADTGDDDEEDTDNA